ncbi:Thioesterase/thiol ester dehydrase-isomerase [Tilletiaria anomala UBC 951]|uniref:Thioesterase/thiol ester dehydrase-isomerase n=1 Tax=Tilletiaria anomala (strain ATCC 24038 / CBS 436.72 / UBC 951) TaxID=1037660 RepID=A0A066VCF9_TILAU|nr:Thioesterase/thiol ester dehydrase-isomerase [Tilletiaria anomala UBC 951]KDN39161.1 Thioesterase/thiol ester dehydrase-isomerase [Tilletiaria anomala UBC 951]
MTKKSTANHSGRHCSCSSDGMSSTRRSLSRTLASEQGQDPLSQAEDASTHSLGTDTASPASTEVTAAGSGRKGGVGEIDKGPEAFEWGVNTRQHIADALAVEEVDVDLYKSVSLWTPSRARGVFGGQVIAQALSAARNTVREGPVLHSMHCYFLLAGDETIPIIYTVKRVRDGGSYVTRSTTASQRGKTIFILISSYQIPEPEQPTFAIPLSPKFQADSSSSGSPSKPNGGPTRAIGSIIEEAGTSMTRPPTMSEQSWSSFVSTLRSPEDSPCNEERYTRVLARAGSKLSDATVRILQAWINDRRSSAVEIRDALPGMYDERGLPTPGDHQAFWMRTREPMRGGADAQKHALAYASDFYLLSAVPKALNVGSKIKMMASLDHSMWFYHDFDVHDWVLYVMQVQAVSNGRGVVLGRLYRRDGTLVAVVAQEGLLRKRFDAPHNL